MAAPFNIVGIDHLVLRAADPAALERFYLHVLGLTFETRQGKLTQLRAGRGLIDIVPRAGHRWGAITKPLLRGCPRLGPIARAHCPRRRLPRYRPRMNGGHIAVISAASSSRSPENKLSAARARRRNKHSASLSPDSRA